MLRFQPSINKIPHRPFTTRAILRGQTCNIKRKLDLPKSRRAKINPIWSTGLIKIKQGSLNETIKCSDRVTKIRVDVEDSETWKEALSGSRSRSALWNPRLNPGLHPSLKDVRVSWLVKFLFRGGVLPTKESRGGLPRSAVFNVYAAKQVTYWAGNENKTTLTEPALNV